MNDTEHELKYSKLIGRPIDNTAIEQFNRCRRLYNFTMRQHRRRRGAPPPSLAYGSIIHHMLDTHYRTGGSYPAVMATAAMKWEDHNRPGDHRTLARACNDYDGYLAKYGVPAAEEGNGLGFTVHRGGQPMLEQTIELQIPGARHPYTGKLDRIIDLQGAYYVEDHKSSSMLRADFFQQFELHNQMLGYVTLAGILTGLPIRGVRINAIICSPKNTKYERQTIAFEPSVLEEWQSVYDRYLYDIEHEERKVRDGDPSAFPPNYNACAHKYGICQFQSICTLSMKHRERAIEQDFPVNPWNPMDITDEPE